MPWTPNAALEYVRDTARTRRPHSRLRSAAPPLPAGPPVGRCSCSEPASPKPPGRWGKMLKTCLKTKEKKGAAAAAGKPAALQGSPWSGAGRLDRTWEAEPIPTVFQLLAPKAQRARLLSALRRGPRSRVSFSGQPIRCQWVRLRLLSAPGENLPTGSQTPEQKTTAPKVPCAPLRLTVLGLCAQFTLGFVVPPPLPNHSGALSACRVRRRSACRRGRRWDFESLPLPLRSVTRKRCGRRVASRRVASLVAPAHNKIGGSVVKLERSAEQTGGDCLRLGGRWRPQWLRGPAPIRVKPNLLPRRRPASCLLWTCRCCWPDWPARVSGVGGRGLTGQGRGPVRARLAREELGQGRAISARWILVSSPGLSLLKKLTTRAEVTGGGNLSTRLPSGIFPEPWCWPSSQSPDVVLDLEQPCWKMGKLAITQVFSLVLSWLGSCSRPTPFLRIWTLFCHTDFYMVPKSSGYLWSREFFCVV